MENEEKLKTGIGNLEPEKLNASKVQVQDVKIETVSKDGKQIGEKVIFICKHPEREDIINLSKVKYNKNDKLVTSGTWLNFDSENKIVKNSALADLINFYKLETLNDFVGKYLETVLDGNYLVIKAY